jgi:gluconate 2-dehydrogenase gamma chain
LDSTRRSFLAQGTGALGLLFVQSLTPKLMAQAHEHARAARISGAEKKLHFLTPQEATDFDAFAAQIIPSDETPGAREAGAVYFTDYVLSNTNAELQQPFRAALATLRIIAAEVQPGATSFASLSPDKQIAVMKMMEKGAPQFSPLGPPMLATSDEARRAQAFGALRGAVLMGTFSDPSLHGNKDKIGWKLLNFDDQSYWAPPFGYYDTAAEEKA